jgi:hypothetical protein
LNISSPALDMTCLLIRLHQSPLPRSMTWEAHRRIPQTDQLLRTPFGRSSRWHRRRGGQAVLLLCLWSSQAVRFTSLAVAPLALKAATTELPLDAVATRRRRVLFCSRAVGGVPPLDRRPVPTRHPPCLPSVYRTHQNTASCAVRAEEVGGIRSRRRLGATS